MFGKYIKVGPRVYGGVDPDAQAFITAAGITDATQQQAINTLVLDLKGYGIWTKMKAIYPFVGGTASTHKWNLKDPRDLDAAFRLVFNGGWTHSSTGATPNGTNGYANTYLNTSSILNISSAHFSKYNRTNDLIGNKVDGSSDTTRFFQQNYSAGNGIIGEIGSIASYTQTDTRGLFTISRTANNAFKVFKNSSSVTSNTTTILNLPSLNVYIGARNENNTGTVFYNTYECAFSSIGDGLTDTEAANLYTAVQAFETTLGRSVGPQTVSDPDAQAFVNAADIQDQVQATAINNLCIDLKGYNIWTKMKAIYPMVGGTATSHKWNLKDPRDLDAAYRLVFNGGWTHSSGGALPNGTNGFANTYLIPSNVLNTDDHSLFFYTNTSNAPISADPIDMGVINTATDRLLLYSRTDFFGGAADGSPIYETYSPPLTTPVAGFALITKQSATVTSVFKKTTKVATGASGGIPPNIYDMIFGCVRAGGGPYGVGWSNNRFAIVGIADGLSDTESVNLYTAVQSFQTTLSRQIP